MKKITFEKEKEVYSFAETKNDRRSLNSIRVDQITSLLVKQEGEEQQIQFRVARNTCLGEKTRWIYGEVLNASDDKYRQIEIKLHDEEPEKDTIEVFLQAPPIKLR